MHRKSLFLEKALDGQTSNMKLYQIQQEKEQEIFLNKFMHHKQESQIEEDLLNESDGDFQFQRKFTDQNIIYQASQKVDVRQDKFVKLEKQNKEIDQRNFNQKWFLRQNSIKKTRRKPSQDDQEEGQNDKCHLKKWFNSSSKKVNKNSMPTNQMENQFQANQLDKMQIPQLTKGSSLQSNPFQIKLQNTFDENTNENIERLTIQQRQKSFIPQIYYEQENSGFCSPVSPEANQTAFSANSSESKTASTEKKMQILNVYSPLKLKKSSISDFQNNQSNQATIQTSKSQVITSFVRQSSEESNQKANPEKKYHIQEILINSNDQQNQKLLFDQLKRVKLPLGLIDDLESFYKNINSSFLLMEPNLGRLNTIMELCKVVHMVQCFLHYDIVISIFRKQKRHNRIQMQYFRQKLRMQRMGG